MNLTCFLLFAFILMISCDPKERNLNKSFGWESDHEIKLIYVKGTVGDTTGYAAFKLELDKKITAKLTAAHLGESVENENVNQTDMLFIVPKEYQKSLDMIIKEIRLTGIIKKFEILEREYVSETEWIDKQIYSE